MNIINDRRQWIMLYGDLNSFKEKVFGINEELKFKFKQQVDEISKPFGSAEKREKSIDNF
jgi:hypothetical protein